MIFTLKTRFISNLLHYSLYYYKCFRLFPWLPCQLLRNTPARLLGKTNLIQLMNSYGIKRCHESKLNLKFLTPKWVVGKLIQTYEFP